MRPLKTPVEGGFHRRVRSGGAWEVQPIGEPEQDILEGLCEQAEIFDVRGCRVEIREVSRLRSVQIVHVLERKELMQANQTLLQAVREQRGAADIIYECAGRFHGRFAAEKQGRVLEGFGVKLQKILQLPMSRGN